MSAMNKPFNFAAKPLAVAVALAGALMVPPQAQAVNVSQNGLGEVLLFPYYTVRNDIDTNINITNTSENTVIFKIRFRESHDSRDARDFNVVLSPYDVWNATVTLSPDGSVARLTTRDKSCTAGKLNTAPDGSSFIDFTNFDYITATGVGPSDGGPTTLDRTKEGHIEVIEMASLAPLNPGAPSPQLQFLTDSSAPTHPALTDSIGYLAQHVSGVPRSCDLVRTKMDSAHVSATSATMREPLNVLKGAYSFVKVTQGKAFAGSPTTLANFVNPSLLDGASSTNILVAPQSQLPSLNDVDPPAVAVVDQNAVGPIVAGFFSRPVDAVSAAISRTAVVNQYSVNPANLAKTDWVVSFPTKYWYVDERTPDVGVSPIGPNPAPYFGLPPFDESTTFQWPRDSQNKPVGDDCAPVTVQFRFFNREEDEVVGQENGFSPAPPGVDANTICHETQVITFNNSDLFNSPNDANVDLTSAGFTSGWMRLEFPGAGQLVSEDPSSTTFTGLPVIGFAATSLENGTNASSVLNYGMLWDHGYVTDIAPQFAP